MSGSPPIATPLVEADFALFRFFFTIGPFSHKSEATPFGTDFTEIYLKFVVLTHLKLYAVPNILLAFSFICERRYFD